MQAALIVRKGATILGVQSADIGQFWKALEFVRRTASRYDFEAMLTTRYPLSQINDAIQNMRAFREIKPLVLPWAEGCGASAIFDEVETGRGEVKP